MAAAISRSLVDLSAFKEIPLVNGTATLPDGFAGGQVIFFDYRSAGLTGDHGGGEHDARAAAGLGSRQRKTRVHEAPGAEHIDLADLKPRIVNPFDERGDFRPVDEVAGDVVGG